MVSVYLEGSDEEYNTMSGKKKPKTPIAKKSSTFDYSSDEECGATTSKKRKSTGRSRYTSILDRLVTANPTLKWKLSEAGGITDTYMNSLNFSKKLAMVTDPYNPRAHETGMFF